MEKKKFLDVVKSKTPLLEQQLLRLDITDVTTIKDTCTSFFEESYKEFIDELNSMEHDIVDPIAELLKEGVVVPQSEKFSQTTKTSDERNDDTSTDNFNKKRTVGFGGAVGAIGGITGSSLSFPWNIIVGGGVSAVLLAVFSSFLSKDNSDRNKVVIKSKNINLNKDQVREIISSLETVANSVDAILNAYNSHLVNLDNQYRNQVESYSLEDRYINVLEEMQAISRIVNSGKDNISEKVQDRVFDFLDAEGYKAIMFTEENTNMFDVKESDVKEIVTYKPAIINKATGKVVLKGTIFKPKN